MSRIQLALDVADLDEAVAFYTTLFGTDPHKTRPGYANFEVAQPPLKLVLFENPANAGGLNHLGVELTSTDEVVAEDERLRALIVQMVTDGYKREMAKQRAAPWPLKPLHVPATIAHGAGTADTNDHHHDDDQLQLQSASASESSAAESQSLSQSEI